jgi:hypothetical protein
MMDGMLKFGSKFSISLEPATRLLLWQEGLMYAQHLIRLRKSTLMFIERAGSTVMAADGKADEMNKTKLIGPEARRRILLTLCLRAPLVGFNFKFIQMSHILRHTTARRAPLER